MFPFSSNHGKESLIPLSTSTCGPVHIEFDKEKLVDSFQPVYHFKNTDGYIVWRKASGDNCELLHLKTRVEGKGYGQYLLQVMLAMLQREPPYATVFGFTRQSNEKACEFYKRNGFTLTVVKGVYAEGTAVLFSAYYEELVRLHLSPDLIRNNPQTFKIE